jgi:NAD(P)-dependent dehydrogenase (short-subunit alcohol dehydrogenase family)
MEIEGAVAVITGAGSGIGRATAQALSERGARVVVTDIDAERASSVASDLPEAISVEVDVTSVDDLCQARDQALATFGQVDIVVSNVGVLAVGNVEDIPLEAWEHVIDVNLFGAVRVNQVFLPALVEQGRGHLVYTASTGGLLPYGFDRLPYMASKHALVGMAQGLAIYLRPKGIGVSCICPAGVVTNILEQMTFYGDMTAPCGPNFPVAQADELGQLVVDSITEGTVLATTSPRVLEEVRALWADPEEYLRNHPVDAEAADPRMAEAIQALEERDR